MFWKDYPEEEDTWEPCLAVIYFWKIVSTFHKNHLEKPTLTSPLLDTVPSIVQLIIKLPAKQKRGQQTKKRAIKRIKK